MGAAEREASRTGKETAQGLLWRLLAEGFVEVVRELRIDFSKPHLSDGITHVPAPEKGKHWGAGLPPEERHRVRLQSLLASRVQRHVRQRLLPMGGYQRRGSPMHRRIKAVWLQLTVPQRCQVLREMRRRLQALNYILFRATLRGLKLGVVGDRHDRGDTALSERLRSKVCPTFFQVVDSLPQR